MVNTRLVEVSTFEAYLTIGGTRGYGGGTFCLDELEEYIASFQGTFKEEYEYGCAVRVAECSIVCQDYQEDCWTVAVINYPRFPLTPFQIEQFMICLAAALLAEFDQERITIVSPVRTSMLERRDADQSQVHKGETTDE